jgi:hypothetical protein
MVLGFMAHSSVVNGVADNQGDDNGPTETMEFTSPKVMG